MSEPLRVHVETPSRVVTIEKVVVIPKDENKLEEGLLESIPDPLINGLVVLITAAVTWTIATRGHKEQRRLRQRSAIEEIVATSLELQHYLLDINKRESSSFILRGRRPEITDKYPIAPHHKIDALVRLHIPEMENDWKDLYRECSYLASVGIGFTEDQMSRLRDVEVLRKKFEAKLFEHSAIRRTSAEY